jgi:hypothetical protein
MKQKGIVIFPSFSGLVAVLVVVPNVCIWPTISFYFITGFFFYLKRFMSFKINSLRRTWTSVLMQFFVEIKIFLIDPHVKYNGPMATPCYDIFFLSIFQYEVHIDIARSTNNSYIYHWYIHTTHALCRKNVFIFWAKKKLDYYRLMFVRQLDWCTPKKKTKKQKQKTKKNVYLMKHNM